MALTGFVVLSATGVLGVGMAAARHALGSLAGRPHPTAAPTQRPSPPPAPRLAAPATSVSKSATVDVRVAVPRGVAGRPGIRVRIYVNDKLARERPLGKARTLAITDVPLVDGANEIRASLVSRYGESRRSNVVEVVYDVVPPAVSISDPADNGVVNAKKVTVRGSTEPGSSVTVTNTTTRQAATIRSASGAFGVAVAIVDGPNVLSIVVVDAAGNRSERSLHVTKGDGKVGVSLALSRTLVYRSRLPGTLIAKATVLDANGRPFEGARVTFSVSPPGLPTSTFVTTTTDGVASWTLAIPREGAQAGSGFATVLVMLPSGRTLRDTQRFTFL